MTLVLKYIEYGLSHDEIHASSQILRQYLWNQVETKPFWRQPTVFGPLPGPRQDAFGRPYTQSLRSSSTRKTTIKFKTSATLLRHSFFPNERYAFEKADTVATASFSLESLENMEWLGGSGYDLFALYIHGVSYKTEDGQTVKGTYCPVLFENLTDPILTGREELGFPKLFSDIDISRSETSCKATLSWRGQQWAELELKDLQRDNSEPSKDKEAELESADDGLFVHKYIPASGSKQRGQPDAQYDVFFPNEAGTSSVRSRRVASPSNVQLKIKTFDDWKQLPTLHLPVNRLAEIPIFEILEGAATEYQGATDLSNAQRLN